MITMRELISLRFTAQLNGDYKKAQMYQKKIDARTKQKLNKLEELK